MVFQVSQITGETKKYILENYTIEDVLLLFGFKSYESYNEDKILEQASKRK